MGGILEDMERRIDQERALAQQKKLQEAQEKARKEAEKAQRANRNNHLIY